MIAAGVLASVLLLGSLHVPRQEAAAPPTQVDPGAGISVYLVTIGPGDQVWELFGHNAIWIRDAASGTDVAYHWGLFNFADPDFIPRFVRGRMLYSMGASTMEETIATYRQANRTVWAQELNLTPAQKTELARLISVNMQTENRDYRYDYFRDNCSTRVRDALDSALGGAIRQATGGAPSNTTYRFHTARLTQGDWPIFTGTMIGLGQPVDRPISAWEEMFLPVKMMERLRAVRLDRDGSAVPLVRSEQVLFQAARGPEPAEVRRGYWTHLALAVVILLAGALLRVVFPAAQGSAITLAVIWSAGAGIAGALLASIWAFTDHLYSYRNENLLQLNPLSLVLAVLLVDLALKRRKAGVAAGSGGAALAVSAVVAGLSVLGFLLQALPGFDQGNGHAIALAMPVHLGVLALLLSLRPKAVGTRTARG